MACAECFDSHTVDLSTEIGRGAYGSVYIGTDKKTSAIVAVKRIAIASEELGRLAFNEIKLIMGMPKHKNIIEIIDSDYRKNAFWIIMDFCEGGDLNCYMVKTKPQMIERVKIMYQCACAVTHLHELDRPIVHRDLKVNNILIKIVNNQAVVKLSDYGLSKMVNMEEMTKTALFKSEVGTLGYMAPEQFAIREYGYQVDLFAMGLVYLALMTYTHGDILIPIGRK